MGKEDFIVHLDYVYGIGGRIPAFGEKWTVTGENR